MQQAARVADMTAFFSVECARAATGGHPGGVPARRRDLLHPSVRSIRTEAYVTGRFG